MRRYFDTPRVTPWLATVAGLALLTGCGGGNPIGDEPAAASTPALTPVSTPTEDPSAVPTLTKPPAAGALGSPTPTHTSVHPDPALTYAMPLGGADGPGRPGGFPVAAGRIVAVDGASFWLEGDPRPMVHWAEQTSFTEFSDAARSDLAVGTCARVRPSRTAGGSGQPQPHDLGAAAVTLSDSVDGICPALPGVGPGAPGGGSPRADGAGPRFEWRPPPPGPGVPRAGLHGLVTEIDGDSFTIEMRRRDVGPSGTSAQPVAQRITTTARTVWQRLATVDSSAVQVGKCATATGRPAGPGHFFAESVTLRPTDDDRCRLEGQGRFAGPADTRGPRVGPRPDGQHRPRYRDRDERRERRERREHERPRERHPEAPSGGSGAGGGAASSQAR